MQIVALMLALTSAALTRPTKDKVYLKLKYSAEQGHAFLRGQSIDCPFACLHACLTSLTDFHLSLHFRKLTYNKDAILIKYSSINR